MTYTNLHTAVESLSRKLYTFAGHSIDPTHTSFCFDQMARAIDHINSDHAVRSVNFDATIWIAGNAVPVIVSIAGSAIGSPVEVAIQMA